MKISLIITDIASAFKAAQVLVEAAKAEAEEEAELVRIDMSQSRIDLQGGINDVGIFKSLVMRLADTDYEHTELEGTETGTQFFSDTLEVRLEAAQKTWNGWDGAFGIQYVDNDFEAVGDEAFVPPTSTTDWGFFVLQEREFGDFKLEIGARYDDVRLKEQGDRREAGSFGGECHFHLALVSSGNRRSKASIQGRGWRRGRPSGDRKAASTFASAFSSSPNMTLC